MEKRIARITRVDTVLNVVDRKLELGFLVQFRDNEKTLAINFREDDEKSWCVNALNGLSSFLRIKNPKITLQEVCQRPKRALFISTEQIKYYLRRASHDVSTP